MMIDAEPLKRYLENVAKTEQAWAATGAAYDKAPVGERAKFTEQFAQTERAYLTACAQLASAVACEVKAAEQAAAAPGLQD